jgi:hypothetical protein
MLLLVQFTLLHGKPGSAHEMQGQLDLSRFLAGAEATGSQRGSLPSSRYQNLQ